MRTRFALAIFFFSLLSPGLVHGKEDVVAVLSSDLQPYQDAYTAFREKLQRPVRVIRLSDENVRIDGEPKVIVAFGGKAALFKYPESSALVYGLAPGTQIPLGRRSGPVTEIPMMPRAEKVFQELKVLQPGLRRLAVIWISPANESYVRELEKAGHGQNVDVLVEKLGKSENLPDRLRALRDHADALWIPSDPLLINEQNLVLLSQFSASAHIPFYSSIVGLTERGAVATLSVSYRTIGQTAAELVQKILSGSTPPPTWYDEDIDVFVNQKAAGALGLDVNGLERVRR